MMGNPAVTAGGKIAFMLGKSGRVVFKLGEREGPRLEPFAPVTTRRPMGGWYTYTGDDLTEALGLAEDSLREVT